LIAPKTSILYAGQELSALGEIAYGLKRAHTGDGLTLPKTINGTVRVTLSLDGWQPAELLKRQQQLRAILREYPSGRLQIEGVLDVAATLKVHDVPEDADEAVLEFAYREADAVESPTDAGTFLRWKSPTQAEIALPNASVNQSFATEYFDSRGRERRQTTVSTGAAGRLVAPADPELTQAQRQAALEEQRAAMELALQENARGILRIGSRSFTHTHVLRFDVAIAGDGEDEIVWSVEFSSVVWPDGVDDDWTQAEITEDTDADALTGETVISISGTVDAPSRELAEAYVEELRIFYAKSGGRVMRSKKVTPRFATGGKGAKRPGKRVRIINDPGTFLGLAFSIVFAETDATQMAWSIDVRDSRNLESGEKVVTYSGSVTGGDAVTALAKARALGDKQLSNQTTAEETVSTQVAQGQERLLQVAFSYTYTTVDDVVSASASRARRVNYLDGGTTVTISGEVVASNRLKAELFANSFKETGIGTLSSEEKVPTWKYLDRNGNATTKAMAVQTFVRVTFSFEYVGVTDKVTSRWSLDKSIDHKEPSTVTTLSGSIKARDVSAAKAEATRLYTANKGRMDGVLEQETFQEGNIEEAGGTQLDSWTFSFVHRAGTADSDNKDDEEEDIPTSGEWSLTVDPPRQRKNIIEIYGDAPWFSEDLGTTTRVVTVSGRIEGKSLGPLKSIADSVLSSQGLKDEGANTYVAQDTTTTSRSSDSPEAEDWKTWKKVSYTFSKQWQRRT
jgi:hypothetical protein